MQSTTLDFNSINKKPYIRCTELTPNKAFNILKAERTTAKYGQRILLELQHCTLYLPERFNSVSDDTLIDISNGGYNFTKINQDGAISYKIKPNGPQQYQPFAECGFYNNF